MTIGDRIQTHRKKLGLSQDELGQKLFVSRQTISQWEKNQTLPTIDNLIRLREIFGASVDEILGFAQDNNTVVPQEVYQFVYTKEELHQIHRLQGRHIFQKTILSTLLLLSLIVCEIVQSAPDLIIGFSFGMLFTGTVSHVKSIHTYNKTWQNSLELICQSTYEYMFFENYIRIKIYRNNEVVGESKRYYSDIEHIHPCGNWFLLQINGRFFIIRKSDLKKNSVFYSYMYQNPTKTTSPSVLNKWTATSIILFITSLLSIPGALVLVGTVSAYNGLFLDNMWLFFVLTPIPIASIIFGIVLKNKGYKYKKNIVVGIITTLLLCIYGSFFFIF